MMSLKMSGARKEVRNAWEAAGTSKYAKIVFLAPRWTIATLTKCILVDFESCA
jgi:hypothetical protein